jgi:antitoxin YefM
MRTANFTDLRKNLKSYLDSVINDSDTVIINRDGNTGAVIMSLDEYNSMKETAYIMSSPATMAAIRQAEKDIADGHGLAFDTFEEFQKWADSL